MRPDGVSSVTGFPDRLRRIRHRDPERDKTMVFLASNFALPAMTVAGINRARWQVEPFSEWIRQHRHTEPFPGTSANAVKTRIWTAVSVCVLMAIIRIQLLAGSETASRQTGLPKQLTLFNF